MCNRLVHLQSDCETIVQGCKFGLAGSRAARGGGERPPDASVAIRTWSACGACRPTRESWDYGVRAGEKARGKWSGRVPGVSGAASPRGGRSRTSYRSRYNYRHRYRYRRGIAASRAFRGCMQNKNLDKHHAKTHRNHREHRMLTTVGLESLTCGARPSTRASWDWAHARGSPDPMGKTKMLLVLSRDRVDVARLQRMWTAVGLGPSTCPPTRERTSVACFRDDVRCDAARVLGLRRPRIAFGACGRDGALVAGTSVHGSSLVSWAAVVDVRFASPPTRGSWDCGHRVGIDEDVRALASSSADV